MMGFWAPIAKVIYDPVQERWRGLSFGALCKITSVGSCPIGKMLASGRVVVTVVLKVEIVGRYELKVVNGGVVLVNVLVLLSCPSEAKCSSESGG